jgi:hypothetical protein
MISTSVISKGAANPVYNLGQTRPIYQRVGLDPGYGRVADEHVAVKAFLAMPESALVLLAQSGSV